MIFFYLKTSLFNKTEINNLFDGYYNKSWIDSAFLNYYSQSQITTFLAGKQDIINGAASTITSKSLTSNLVLISNASGKVAVSSISDTKFGYLTGVTSNIQSQLNGEQATITRGYNNWINF